MVAATILVKVKSHLGEPVNEYADVSANKGLKTKINRLGLSGKTRLCKEYVRRKSCGLRQLKKNAKDTKRGKHKKEMKYQKKKWRLNSVSDS